jgi:murein L,D-transpeptidase YcbB/YkuD
VLVAQVAAAPTAATIDRLKPNHFIYAGLRGALARYRDIAARGGWPLVPSGPPIKPDEAAGDKRIAAIRARLVASGELPAANASGDTYDATLQAAVKTFQERHRLTPDAVVGKTTIDAMNVNAEAGRRRRSRAWWRRESRRRCF